MSGCSPRARRSARVRCAVRSRISESDSGLPSSSASSSSGSCRPIIPAEDVARDFFGLSADKFVRKVSAGAIAFPLSAWKHRRNAPKASTSMTSPTIWTRDGRRRSRNVNSYRG
ncbi:pyocin activator PrtN family protein [Martelella lutilitoris]|uniref:pyocin activator PrtN family protein n=1 Tax=Martelella lutilitoris TaxID=2583532 RepID=UPI003D7C30E4